MITTPKGSVRLALALLVFAGLSLVYVVSHTSSSLVSVIQELPSGNTQTATISGAGSGLVAHYTFDDGIATDSSGNGNHGTLVNRPTPTTGKIGGAVQFDGVSSYININQNFATLVAGPRTISAWVLRRSGTDTKHAFSINYTDARNAQTISSQATWRGGYRANNLTLLDSSVATVFNRWTHVVVIQNGTNVEVYVDGVLKNSATNAGWPQSTGGSNKNAFIGAQNINGVAQDFWPGSVDDIRVYNRTLSASEISELYALGLVGGAAPSATCSDGIQNQNETGIDCGGVCPACQTPTDIPADTTPPVISAITASSITTSQVTISWTTNEPSTTQVRYGETMSYVSQTSEDSTPRTLHNQTITNLQPNTVYNYQVISKDSAGNTAQSSNQTFTTSQVQVAMIPAGSNKVELRSSAGALINSYTTVQACANVVVAGQTCRVYSGTYNEKIRVDNNGTSNSKIVFKNNGGAIVQGFDVRGNYVRVEDFNITGVVTKFGAMFYARGNNLEIINNVLYSPTTDDADAISLSGSYGLVSGNVIHGWPIGAAFTIQGVENIIEYNTVRDSADIDVFRVFGNGHIIRKNVVKNIIDGPRGNHIDFIQAFGHNNSDSYDIMVENNIIDGIQGQISQFEQTCGLDSDGTTANSNNCTLMYGSGGIVTSVSTSSVTDSNINWIRGNWTTNHWKGRIISFVTPDTTSFGKLYLIASSNSNTITVTNLDGSPANLISDGIKVGDTFELRMRIGWYTFKNNVFKNITNGMSMSMPYVNIIHNTFIDTPSGISNLGSRDRGWSFHMKVSGNVKIDSDTRNKLYAPTNIAVPTFFADYNYLAGVPFDYVGKNTSCPDGFYTFQRFCETQFGKHGISGGNPGFQNVNDPAGPVGGDRIPFTSDDGLRPSTLLCGKGEGGKTIGAYSCSGENTISSLPDHAGGNNNPPTLPPPASDTTPPTVSLTAPTANTTVSGTAVTISATASDNNAIAGVQFRVNGSNVGSEDTTSPYSIVWNTTTVVNGTYTITAVARDTANLTTTSAGRTVTVNNTVATPPSTVFTAGNRVKIVQTGVNIRSVPTTVGNTPIGTHTTGDVGTIVSNAQNGTFSDGYYWWNVNYDSGVDGWTAENYLEIYVETPPVVTGDCSLANIRCVDDTPGATQEYSTIKACANVANAGDTCLVYPGNYPEYVQVDRGGTVGSPVTFKANGLAVVQGFRIKRVNVTVDGFDITKYAVGLSPAHFTIEPAGSNCKIINNNIHDGITLYSERYYFNGSAKTITNPNGGFIAAGFEAGASIYLASNPDNTNPENVALIQKNGELYKNANTVKKIKSVTDTTITLVDTDTLNSEGTSNDGRSYLIYVTRSDKAGVGGIEFISTSANGAAGNCVIANNIWSNLGGMAMDIKGSGHLIERNIIEKMNGWWIINFVGSNNTFRYNHVKNSPRYPGFEPTFKIVHNAGVGTWDFYASLFRSFGSTVMGSVNNVFEYNFFENLDNQFATVTDYAPGYENAVPSQRVVFKNNVFIGLEEHGAFHRKEIVFENNTFYKSVPDSKGAIFIISSTVEGSADGSIIKNNAFVDNASPTEGGWYSVQNVQMAEAPNYNFVAGPASQGYPAKTDFVGKEATSDRLNGGNPKFQNINNPVGPDGIPFTSDDGLKPLSDSPLCTGGESGGYIGAYSCSGTPTVPPPVNPPATPSDTTAPTVSITSPLPGASVIPSNISVTANASDNVGVVGVQFKVNGQNLGAEDTTAPYTIVWNATTLPDGTYTLTAVARDAKGNTKTSSPVTVTISTPIVTPTDSDNDGVPNTLDVCPNTSAYLVAITPSVINQRGCPIPKMSTFSIKPNLTNTDLRSVSSLELGNSYAKVTYPTGTYSLVRTSGNTHDRLDIDANLKITQGTISLDSKNLPELNKPVRLTFYGVTVSNPTILKDGAICSTCTNAVYDPIAHTISFNVTGFSTYSISFTPITDTTAPTVVNDTTPTSLPAGTTNTTLSVTTDESATCKYSTSASTAYSSMTNTFATTNNVSHTANVTGLTNGQTYNYYVRCKDTADNATTTDLHLSFSVANPAPVTPPSGGGGGGGGGSPSTPGGGGSRTVVISTTNTTPITTSINPSQLQATLTPNAGTPSYTFTKYLKVGSTGNDVKVLQQTLNSLGYKVSVTGAGSPGNETTYYGPATTFAIQKFQCAILRICSGSPTTNGYGNFGPATRSALSQQTGRWTNESGVPSSISQLPASPAGRPTPSSFSRPLKLGSTGADVKALQVFLNTKGFTVSVTGAGSPGFETNYFGPATARAVSAFQKAYASEILTPIGLTQGTGLFGPGTMRKVNALLNN